MDITEVDHPSITAENREGLSRHMEKFDSFEAAAVDGMSLKKLQGAPFKMPESLDKLPDDTTRSDFTAQARKVLGINIAKDIEGLKDVNFKVGLADDAPFDEDFVGIIKNWAVEKGVDTATIQSLAELYNGPLTEHSVKAFKTKEDATFDTNAKATNEGLVKHFGGSQEKVDSESDFFRTAILNHPGTTVERATKVADVIVEAMQRGGSDAAIVLLEMIAPMAKEGGTHAGTGGNKPATEQTTAKQLPKTAKVLGWDK